MRSGAHDVLKHNFFSGIEWADLRLSKMASPLADIVNVCDIEQLKDVESKDVVRWSGCGDDGYGNTFSGF